MARGKHAALSANRRAAAAHEVIDRLTTELADAKLRARQAEARAARADQLELLLTERNGDAIIKDLMTTIHEWKRIAKDDKRRRKAAIDEMFTTLAADIRQSMRDIPPGVEDLWEFMVRRYPSIIDALMAQDGTAKRESAHPYRRGREITPTVAKFSDERLKEYQRAQGRRVVAEWDPDRDFADVMADLLDAHQLSEDPDEILEMVGVHRVSSDG